MGCCARERLGELWVELYLGSGVQLRQMQQADARRPPTSTPLPRQAHPPAANSLPPFFWPVSARVRRGGWPGRGLYSSPFCTVGSRVGPPQGRLRSKPNTRRRRQLLSFYVQGPPPPPGRPDAVFIQSGLPRASGCCVFTVGSPPRRPGAVLGQSGRSPGTQVLLVASRPLAGSLAWSTYPSERIADLKRINTLLQQMHETLEPLQGLK